MVRHHMASSVILLPLVLAGCAQWTHPTKSAEAFARDDALCRQQAIEKVSFSAAKQEAPKWVSRGAGTKPYNVDGNNPSRDHWHRSCLVLEGWSQGSMASQFSSASTELVHAGRRLVGQ